MGVGFGLMMLIGVAGGSMNEGIGVGGFLVIMGLAFFINGLFDHPRDDYPPAPPRPSGTLRPDPSRSLRAGTRRRVSRPIHRRDPYRYSPTRADNLQVMSLVRSSLVKHCKKDVYDDATSGCRCRAVSATIR